tara:strand:- start:597 stop:845 length:249 start_codon:yes stop_codon:yes gene_type:complete
MTSSVDATFPADNTKVSKATFRAQMLIIKNELTSLQTRTGVASSKAYYDYVDQADLQLAITRLKQQSTFASDIAYGRLSINS